MHAQNKPQLILTLLGLPGSGKGTQGKLLAKELHFEYISTGALVRQVCFYNKKKNIDIPCAKIRARVEKGIPQPNSIMKQLLHARLDTLTVRHGLILDSYPLSLGQIRDFKSIENRFEHSEHYVLFLKVSQKVILERISQRKICPKDDSIYAKGSKNFEIGICSCGATLVRRDDDKPSVVKQRIKEYNVRFEDLLDHYKKKKRLIVVNASNEIAVVHTEAMKKIRMHLHL